MPERTRALTTIEPARNHPGCRLRDAGFVEVARCRAPADEAHLVLGCSTMLPAVADQSRCRPRARRRDASTRTARTRAPARRRRERQRSWQRADRRHSRSRTPRGRASMSVFKSLDRSTVVTSTSPSSTTTTKPGHAVHDDRASRRMHDVVARRPPRTRVPATALPRRPFGRTRLRAPHVPTSSQPKSPGNTTTRLLRSSTPTSTEIGRHGAEEAANVVGVRVQGRRHLRRQPSHVVEKITDAPDEDPRVPQIAVASHHLGARAVGLLDEARDTRRTPGSSSFPGWM